MCKKPIYIPNKNVGSKLPYSYLKDTEHDYLAVPCGHCEECIAIMQMYLVQRMQMESKLNHMFMCTLTYKDSMIPKLPLGDYDIRYASVADFQRYVKRLRKDNVFPRPFRYLAVSERGSLHSRPHFHIIWLLPKYDFDTYSDCLDLQEQLYPICFNYWSRNYGSKRVPIYKSLSDLVVSRQAGRIRSTYDLHYVNPPKTLHGISDVAFYVTKYVLKRSPESNEEKLRSALKLNYPDCFPFFWKIVRSRLFLSRDFGGYKQPLVRDYIRKCIDDSDKRLGYPQYFDENGNSFPLSPFYWKQPTRILSRSSFGDPLEVLDPIYTDSDAHDFYFNYDEDLDPYNTLVDVPEVIRMEKQFSKIQSLFNTYDLFNDF